jgi:sugar-specific transcriptional regulator TrmB
MADDCTEILTRFNISPTASKVYIALLELGKSSADKIAKRAETYKANVYDALEKLSQLGLVSYVFEENKRLFIPTNPKKLPQMIEDIKEKQFRTIDELKRELNDIMPQLKAKYESVKEKDLFEIYRGRKAYKSIINEILKEKPKIWKGFGNFQVQAFFPIDFQRWFKNVEIKLFSTKSDEIIKRMKEAEKTTSVQVIWLPKEVYMPIVWVIFGDNVLIVLYEHDLILMRIKSEQIVKTFSNQFDYLWKKYKT